MEQPKKNTVVYARWVLIRLALVVYDIFAVNFAYFAALVIRFYVASEFNVWAVRYIPAFQTIAPYYTVCAVAVFWLFKLYNSRWKYASLNDLRRIWLACAVTCVIYVLGSLLFVMRMPITYYLLGAVIQFALIAISRFAYRMFLSERDRVRKHRNKTAINVMVVGVGESSWIVRRHLDQDAQNAAQTVCVLDFRGNEFGNMIEGVPLVSGIDKLSAAIGKYAVECVILADATLPEKIRLEIRDICRELDVDVQNFTSFFQTSRGDVSLRSLLEFTKGPVELVVNDQRLFFTDGEQAMMSLPGKYIVSGISARDSKLVVELQQDLLVPNDVHEEWVQTYKQETGEDISFF